VNVFGRAGLQRTVFLVVALSLAAGATSAFARAFRAADTGTETLEQTRAGAIERLRKVE